jgi:hypothetical protein
MRAPTFILSRRAWFTDRRCVLAIAPLACIHVRTSVTACACKIICWPTFTLCIDLEGETMATTGTVEATQTGRGQRANAADGCACNNEWQGCTSAAAASAPVGICENRLRVDPVPVDNRKRFKKPTSARHQSTAAWMHLGVGVCECASCRSGCAGERVRGCASDEAMAKRV